jgi:hypothetical protein
MDSTGIATNRQLAGALTRNPQRASLSGLVVAVDRTNSP